MGLNNAAAGGDFFQFDVPANEGALIAFRIREYREPRLLTRESTKPVDPVVVDFVVLTGSLAKTVRRGEEIVKAGITGPLRRSAIGEDVVCRMEWMPPEGLKQAYIAANPCTPDEFAKAVEIFTKTGGDPYTATERAGALQTAAPAAPPVAAAAPAAPVAAAPAAPAVDPAYAAWQAQQAAAAAAQPAAPVAEAPPWQPPAQQAEAAAPAPAAPQPAMAAASDW